MATVEKLLPAVFNVMSLALPAASVVAPVTARAPLCVIAPVVFTPSVPDTVDAPRTTALVSVKLTLLPLVMATVEKLLPAVFNVMSPPEPAASVVTPVTASAPLCVIAPVVFTPSVPDTVDAPRITALLSVKLTLLPLMIATAPMKSLPELFSVTLFKLPAAILVVPLTLSCVLATWVMTPAPLMVRLPVATPPVVSMLPRTLLALVLISETLPPPLAIEPPAAKVVAAVPLSIETALSELVTALLMTTALLPLVNVKPPGVVMALSCAMLLVWVPRLSALEAPASVAASVAAFTVPVCVMVPPAASVTAPAVPVAPLLMPEIANPFAAVY